MLIEDAVLLAGGKATRLAPFNKIISKNLLNVNGRCIIDYSIDTLKDAGVKNLTIVVGPPHSGQIIDYIGDGSQYELNINYVVQTESRGISHAIAKCQRFVNKNFICILGDNFYNNKINWKNSANAEIVLTQHQELNRFGVASLDNNKIIEIVEKPIVINHNTDNYVITGCYKLTESFFDYFKLTSPSQRGEFELIEVLNYYLKENKLAYNIYKDKWWDIGTHESIASVNNYFWQKNIHNGNS